MADEGGSGGGSGTGFFFLFFGGIFALWLVTTLNGGVSIFSDTSSSTGEYGTSTRESIIEGEEGSRTELSMRDIGSEVADAHTEVSQLKEEVRLAKLWGVVSPYKDIVSLSRSSVTTYDPDEEYLTLSLSSDAETGVTLSGWILESTVTGRRESIPLGARLPRNNRINTESPIVLEPGEEVYLITGSSPIGTSFHENACTEYFAQYQDFHPSLSSSCPNPLDDMKDFGNISLTDDSCYEAVESFSSCKVPSRDEVSKGLSSECRSFILNNLTYAGCVANHSTDPSFIEGSWFVYFEKDRELWREEREIIRLLDREGRTVSVLEY